MRPNKPSYTILYPNDKEKKQWDKLVEKSSNGNIYSLSWYLDIVTEQKWGLVVNEDFSSALPFAFKKRPGYKNIYQPFYTMYFDVIGDGNMDEMLEPLEKEFHQILITTQSKIKDHTSSHRVRQELVLKDGFEKTFSENATRQIKKAEKAALSFQLHEKTIEVVKLFKENKGGELKEYKAADFKRMQSLMEECISRKKGFCAHVTQGKTVLASGFFLSYENRVVFLKGGITEEGKKCGAMYFLMDKVMKHLLKSEKATIFDFGGSNNRNVRDFYRKLGGKDVDYLEVIADRRNIFQKTMSKLKI